MDIDSVPEQIDEDDIRELTFESTADASVGLGMLAEDVEDLDELFA